MEVYDNGNGDFWGYKKHGEKLTEFSIGKTFLWGKQEIRIPAVYVGQTGAVVDVCAKIPQEDMILFLKKWDQKKRLSLESQEEFEQLEADNPGSREFTIEIRINGSPLTSRMRSSLRWYPMDIFPTESPEASAPAALQTDKKQSGIQKTSPEWQNDRNAESLMTAYGCDRTCCWYFGRLIYNWDGEPILSPKEISLRLSACPFPVTAGHFTTDLSCRDEEFKTIHPITGQEYTVTLHECEQNRLNFSEIGKNGMLYPEYCQTLSYSISPEIERGLFDIRDCAQSDQPRKADAADDALPGVCGASAVFMAGKNPRPDRRTSCSSLHFEPVSEIRWRAVFQVKHREDMEICFPVKERNFAG